MLATAYSSATLGVDAYLVDVEVDVARGGMGKFQIVGLPDAAVKESVERVGVALRSQAYRMPATRILVNLAPADIRKEGPSFDLPIALGVLAGSRQIPAEPLSEFLITGELSLDGRLRPISGALPMALAAREAGKRAMVLPAENAREAAIVRGLEVYPAETIREAVNALTGHGAAFTPEDVSASLIDPTWEIDMGDVRGQEHVKRALEVAAAGGHNIITFGAGRLQGSLFPLCNKGGRGRSARRSREVLLIHSPAFLCPLRAYLRFLPFARHTDARAVISSSETSTLEREYVSLCGRWIGSTEQWRQV
jgi:magnesium chelatase family protein